MGQLCNPPRGPRQTSQWHEPYDVITAVELYLDQSIHPQPLGTPTRCALLSKVPSCPAGCGWVVGRGGVGIALSLPASARLFYRLGCLHIAIFQELEHVPPFQECCPGSFILIYFTLRLYILLTLRGIFCLFGLTLRCEVSSPCSPTDLLILPSILLHPSPRNHPLDL